MKKSGKLYFVILYGTALITLIIFCYFGSHTVTTMVQTSPIPNRTIIVIDAGHGGIDGGATSCTGILESQTNLQIALRLNALMHLIGFDTKMIRTTDTSVYTQGNTIASQKVSDLKNRVQIVNETPNALLISIHQNTFSDQRYHGAQVFTSDNTKSKQLSQEMQSAFINTINPESNRKVKSGKGIYLLENIEKPGILIECGFISNHEEAMKLNDPSYQKKLCAVIGCVISKHNPNT